MLTAYLKNKKEEADRKQKKVWDKEESGQEKGRTKWSKGPHYSINISINISNTACVTKLLLSHR